MLTALRCSIGLDFAWKTFCLLRLSALKFHVALRERGLCVCVCTSTHVLCVCMWLARSRPSAKLQWKIENSSRLRRVYTDTLPCLSVCVWVVNICTAKRAKWGTHLRVNCMLILLVRNIQSWSNRRVILLITHTDTYVCGHPCIYAYVLCTQIYARTHTVSDRQLTTKNIHTRALGVAFSTPPPTLLSI